MANRNSPKYKPVKDWSDREKCLNMRGKYVLVKIPEHPRAHCGGWVYEHRLVMEKYHGRLLSHWETVHHISEDKTDNREINLVVCYRHEHDRAHRTFQVMAQAS